MGFLVFGFRRKREKKETDVEHFLVLFFILRAPDVWSPSGGWYADPRGWRKNTAMAFG